MSERLHPGLNLGPAHGAAHDRSEVTVFGFWVFLMSDLVTFGILFATYASSLGPMARALGPGPAEVVDLTRTAIQTGFLLASSFTCGLASLALKYQRGPGRLVAWLALTGLLGAGFLVFEIRDFAAMAALGAVPGRSAWASSLWALVGLHGLHITAGLAWIMVMVALVWRVGLTDTVRTRLLMFALYWHFLDLVWIGIFSVVFLAGVA